MFPNDEIRIHLEDTEWPLDYIDHDRLIARAIVCDDAGQLYFVRAERDDIFGPATVIETAGGGVEPGEDPDSAILRELQEELGVHTEILCRIGIVDDYYHLVHRHNINHYYLCRILSFGERNLTEDEQLHFHLSTLKLSYEQAFREYQLRTDSPLGRLIAQREIPVLEQAEKIHSAYLSTK